METRYPLVADCTASLILVIFRAFCSFEHHYGGLTNCIVVYLTQSV